MQRRVLLVHQNFPGQYLHLAPALVRAGVQVTAVGMRELAPPAGVRYVRYRPQRSSSPGIHPWVGDFETKVIRGEACMQALATLKAPEKFSVRFKTTKGDITLQVTRAWSPLGADRFFNLVKIGYFKDIAFFRAVPNFMAQFGIHGDPAVNNVWRDASIPDDPPAGQSNKKYFLTFAKKGIPNSRSVQFFVNFKDNAMLDTMGFTPIGEVTEGKENFDKINTQYGEGAPRGMGPDQMRVQTEGNAYLKKDFPALDYILSAEVL